MYELKNRLQTGFGAFCFTTTFLYIFAAFSCASAPDFKKSPRWVLEPSSVYPDGQYLTAVGYAVSRNAAEAAAVAALTKSINQKVEVYSASVQAMETGKEQVSRAFSSTVNTFSVVDEIAGLKIQEVWSASEDQVYALALINREQVGSYYEQKIKNAENGINASIAFAADNSVSFEGIAALNNAVQNAVKNDKFLSILSVVHPLKYKNLSLAYKNTQTLEALLWRETEKIHISVKVENDKSGRIENAFSQVFREAGFKTVLFENAASGASLDLTGAPYTLKAVLKLEFFEASGRSENKYVRYTVNAELKDRRSEKNVLPWSLSGREAHFTQAEAEQRALRTIETEIKKQFLAQVLKVASL